MNQLQKDKLRAFYIKFRWIGTGLWEFILNVFISTLPISIGVIVLMVSSKHNHSLFQAINYITARGELVIYSATLMAPILYAIQKDPPPKLRRFLYLMGIATLISGIVIYAVGISDGFSDKIHGFSYVCLTLALSSFCILNLVSHKMETGKSAPLIHEAKAKSSLTAYQNHRRG